MLIVVKYGGNAMPDGSDDEPVLDDIAGRIRSGDRLVIVHGGGPQIDAELLARGLTQERVAGLRITDAATLAIAERVLCATVNKALVRALGRRHIPAVGISGQDGALIVARRASAVEGRSLGFVGEIEEVHPAVLTCLLAAGFVPVVAPVGIAAGGSSALNVNADTAAGAIAGALEADAYVAVTNVDRVRERRDDPESGLERLPVAHACRLMAAGAFDGGMRPKIESALDALRRGARSAIICGSGPASLTLGLEGRGTTIVHG